ncbi:MAG: hypothetical protein WAK48_25405 [Candidatus Acidiferrum sp.]|jgi:hypothetical protein
MNRWPPRSPFVPDSTGLSIGESEATNDIALMIVYHSLFREHHFPNLAPFKPDAIRDLLKNQLANGTPSIRAATTNQLKIVLEKKEREFIEVVPYLEAFVSGRSVRVANYHLYGLLAPTEVLVQTLYCV